MQPDLTLHVRHSNLIESVDDPREDAQSLKAWHYLSAQEQVGIPELLETHRQITLNQLNAKNAGHFRTVPVHIGGHLAPTPFMAQQMIHNLMLDLRDRPHEIDPREAHIRFEHAHPFIDGNGRTGRLLFWYHEIKIGREPTLILSDDEHRQAYYQWFREAA